MAGVLLTAADLLRAINDDDVVRRDDAEIDTQRRSALRADKSLALVRGNKWRLCERLKPLKKPERRLEERPPESPVRREGARVPPMPSVARQRPRNTTSAGLTAHVAPLARNRWRGEGKTRVEARSHLHRHKERRHCRCPGF